MKNYLLMKSKKIPTYLKYYLSKTRLDGLVFNKTYVENLSGTSFYLDHSVEDKIKINLKASESTQNTTAGKNLLPTQVNAWEPYTNGASPNPDYPQDIHVVKGDNEVVISNSDNTKQQNYPLSFVGKNKFNIATIKRGVELNSNTGLEQPNAKWWISDFIYIKPNTEYTSSNISSLTKCWYDKDKNFISRVQQTTGTSPSNSRYLRVNGTIASIESNPDAQIEEGSVVTTFEEYKSIEFCNINNYADEIFKNVPECEYYDNTLEEGKWYKLSNIGKLVLNGSENWGSLVAYEHNGYNLSVDDILLSNNNSNPSLLLSDYFKGYNVLELFQNNISSYGIVRRTNLYQIIIRNDLVNSLAEFKEWLENNNVTVYYPLKNPTKTLLSDTLQEQLENIYNNAHTYDKITNINQVNEDRPFILDITYYRKVK